LITHPYQMQAPRLDFIVGAQALREGERVITSGDGGLFPRGISVGVAQRQSDGSWRVALSAAQRPIDFVRLIPFTGIDAPENAPAEDDGPPLNAASSVAVIGRETMAPAPVAPTSTPAPPRPAATTPTSAPRPTTPATTPAQTPPRAEPTPAPEQPAPQPAEPNE
jgi:rod shape-determining protein MreC